MSTMPAVSALYPLSDASPSVHLVPQGAHTMQSVTVRPGTHISLGFAPEEATLEKQDRDLLFFFDDGSVIALKGFFTALLMDESLAVHTKNGRRLSGRALRDSFQLFVIADEGIPILRQ